MKRDVRRKLDEVSALFWTDQEVVDAINEGLAEMADATEYFERQAHLNLLAGRTYYDLTSILPDTFLSPRRAWNTTTETWLRPSGPREHDGKYAQWELTNGEPETYFLRGNWWLGVWPRKPEESSSIRLYYTGMPDPMTNDTDEPTFPREFHPGVVAIAISDCLAQERETAKALEYWAKGMTYAEGLKLHVQGRQKIARTERL